jgi:hypothetical protein
MSDTFLSQTELGRHFSVSSPQIGKWLIACGLRTPNKKPSPKAFADGFVEQRDSRQPGTYFWVWHREKTLAVLTEAGHSVAVNSESPASS